MDYSFIILIASVFISRWLLLGAFKQLTDEEKAKVLSRVVQNGVVRVMTIETRSGEIVVLTDPP